MIRILSIFFVVLLSINNLLAQENKAAEIDEFSQSNSEMMDARLDTYAQALYDNPSASLQILIHRGENQSLGAPYKLGAVMKDYIVYHRRAGDRVSITYCEPEKSRRVNVWLLPVGVRPQTCSPPAPFVFTETILFDVLYNFDVVGCCLVDEFSKVKSEASLSAFSQELKRNPESKAYVYLYKSNLTEESRKSSFIKKWRKTIIESLTKDGVESSRIIVKYGGYRKQSETMELWFVPKNGIIPKAKTD